MRGLEYIFCLCKVEQRELADKLGIRNENIDMWIKGEENIPKKYLPILQKQLGVRQEYFMKELSEHDKLEIQKEKLKNDLRDVVNRYENQLIKV